MFNERIKYFIASQIVMLFLCLSAHSSALTREQAEAIVNSPDRTPDERLDARRKPVELLLFTGAEPGMKVADLDAGRGWTTLLMAHAVGPKGTVYSRTRAGREDGLKQTLQQEGLNNVVVVGRDMTDPLPADVTDLDLVIVQFAYHHLITQPENVRKQAYANVMRALKPGGSFVVVDTQAKEGAGPETGNTIHRLAPDLMQRDLEQAGFKLADSGDFIQNPNDPLDVSGRQVDGTPSAFVHRYVKPE